MRRKYVNGNKKRRVLDKQLKGLPTKDIKNRRNYLKNLECQNITLAHIFLTDILRGVMPITWFSLLTVAYNHTSVTNDLLKKVYPTLWKSMKRVDVKAKRMEGMGYTTVLPPFKFGMKSSFLITPKGRTFVEQVNRRLFSKIRRYGKGIPYHEAIKKDKDLI